MLDVNFFDDLRIGLATAEDIRQWSHGEVKKPETINYRTLKPEKDGLFCEKIFGPTRDWECYCGKYKRVRFKGIICERCGVEVTRAKVRRERMGHIELAAPVTHIWYFKGVPSRLGYLLDLAPKDLEKVIYFAAYMITYVDDEARQRDLPSLEARITVERTQLEQRRDNDIETRQKKLEGDLAELEASGAKGDARRKVRESADREMKQIRDRAAKEIDRIDEVWSRFKGLKVQDLEGDELLYREMRDRFGRYFRGGMGAQAIQDRLATFDLDAEANDLRETIRTGKGQKKARALKRLKVVSAFLNTRNSPMGMVLDCIPVIPPDLRPMVQLDGGRFATSDLNDLYRRVINRNNRLKRLLDLGAPEIIVNNEKRMLQEAVDSLFDNGRRGRPVTGPGNRPLKSLSDMLKGKQGRFRQNLLGKRVDYSGRSVIVVGPQLKLHQCGLPKQMALELFKPFVMKRLVDLNHAQNIKSAKRMVERAKPVVWDVLEEVITEHPVLLNRAPTLHRLGIQAFEPQLVEGKAIQIHPLVCTAFNADFDGDQMAVHVPLSAEAQAEARILMLSTNNILKPADGKPVTMPTQDMIIGIYCLTREAPDTPGTGRAFANLSEAVMAYDRGELDLQAKIDVRLRDVTPPLGSAVPEGWQPGMPLRLTTTLGRCYFNETLPASFPFVNYEVAKKQLSAIVNELAETYPKVEVAQALDALKDAGFHWATRAGVTIAIEDVVAPPNKREILDTYERRADKVQREYERGLITDDERRQELIEIWTHATADVARDMESAFPETNSVWMMVNSGARGNLMQVRQIAGMRGLVSNPKGETIPRPIKASFREGLSVLEYFISTHGARKGLADTALRTADSGYLTRRLVDVAQDVIVREEDCGTDRSLPMKIGDKQADGSVIKLENIENTGTGRTISEDIEDADGNVLVAAGADITESMIDMLVSSGVASVRTHSALVCQAKYGVCGKCYGRSLATGKRVDVGEAVGIVAAQSIGEPGTQLTMRTFHTGGVAGQDITHGLPRIQELFEARIPKGMAPISEVDGTVKIEETEKARKIIVVPDDGGEEIAIPVPMRSRLLVADGDHVTVGEQLIQGAVNPHEVLRILGSREVQMHLVHEVQEVYRSQGVSIHDKH
ncbi:MAG TPA: DNA-directed RNA polymerase subunit beta', partial [Candidatus Acidoferrum sp.]|nr:DNA-directed RNA polymerase subunit beta' [Candidatus Acidoferrum sp.]